MSSCRVVLPLYPCPGVGGQLGLHCTVEPNYNGLSARLAGTSVTRDRALDTCKPSCVPGAARSFFIPVVHSPLGTVGYVAAPELSSLGGEATWQCQSPPQQGGEVQSEGTRGSAGAHLGMVVRSRAEERMTALELNSARRRGPGPWSTWQHRSSPQYGGEARGRGTHGGSRVHLCRDVWSEAIACVAVRGCTPCSLS
jgi:hypothetical protein